MNRAATKRVGGMAIGLLSLREYLARIKMAGKRMSPTLNGTSNLTITERHCVTDATWISTGRHQIRSIDSRRPAQAEVRSNALT